VCLLFRLEEEMLGAGWVAGSGDCPACQAPAYPSVLEHWATHHRALRRLVQSMTRGACVRMKSARQGVRDWLAAPPRRPAVYIRKDQLIREKAAALQTSFKG
jgi:hypothetical protein